MSDYMKKPCPHCPYRRDVKPFLHPDRGAELAYAAQNEYNEFHCHKTTETVEYDDGENDRIATERSKMCAGFLTLMAQECGTERVASFYPGFEPSWEVVYTDASEMCDAYESV